MSTSPCEKRKVAIIGSGLGGLACAVQLAHAGHKVTVFEKNEEPGGRMGSVTKEGFTWDASPSPLTQPETLRKLWDHLGRKLEDYLKLIPLPTAARYFWADGTHLDDDAAFRQRREVAQYLAYGKGAHEIAEPFSAFRQDDWGTLFRMAHLGKLRHLPKLMPGLTMHRLSKKFFSDPRLVQVFDHFATQAGASPFAAPGVLSYLAALQAEFGSWHVEGGTHEIIQAFLRVAAEQGVQVKTHCEVTGVFDSSIAIAGKWETFDAVICNQDVLMAFQTLLPRRRCGEFRDAYLNHYRISLSAFSLQLGVDHQYPQLSHRNVFFSEDPEREFRQLMNERSTAEEPTIELTVTSRTEPGLAPEGGDNWSIQVDAPPLRSSVHWEEIGEAFAQRIIERLEKQFGFTDLQSHVVARSHVTPSDYRNRFQCFGGGLQGFAAHGLRNALIGPAMQPPGLSGFFFAGASMRPGGGIPQVLENAHNAALTTLHHLKGLPGKRVEVGDEQLRNLNVG